MASRWSTSGPRGGNAHFLPLQEYNRGIGRKIEGQTNKHEQCLGLTQEQKESYATLCITDSIYGLRLAWVTSENSTKQLECRLILTQSSSLDPIFSATVSGVDRISPCRIANWLSTPFSNQLSFVSPYHFGIRRDFRSKNPLSGFAPKQTKESSACGPPI